MATGFLKKIEKLNYRIGQLQYPPLIQMTLTVRKKIIFSFLQLGMVRAWEPVQKNSKTIRGESIEVNEYGNMVLLITPALPVISGCGIKKRSKVFLLLCSNNNRNQF